MTHLRKENWPTAFLEGKKMADHVLHLNKVHGKFGKQKPEGIPTDRELVLSAAVNVFWDYKIAQEAGAAARRITLEKTIDYLSEHSSQPGDHQLNAKRLVKLLRRIHQRTEGENFLAMWAQVERFLTEAQKPEFWKNFNEPQTAVRLLVAGLGELAEKGEKDNDDDSNRTKTEKSESEEGPAERAEPSAATRETRPEADHGEADPSSAG